MVLWEYTTVGLIRHVDPYDVSPWPAVITDFQRLGAEGWEVVGSAEAQGYNASRTGQPDVVSAPV